MDLVEKVEQRHEFDTIDDLKDWEEVYSSWSDEEAADGNWYGADYWSDHAKIVRLMREEREEGA